MSTPSTRNVPDPRRGGSPTKSSNTAAAPMPKNPSEPTMLSNPSMPSENSNDTVEQDYIEDARLKRKFSRVVFVLSTPILPSLPPFLFSLVQI